MQVVPCGTASGRKIPSKHAMLSHRTAECCTGMERGTQQWFATRPGIARSPAIPRPAGRDCFRCRPSEPICNCRRRRKPAPTIRHWRTDRPDPEADPSGLQSPHRRAQAAQPLRATHRHHMPQHHARIGQAPPRGREIRPGSARPRPMPWRHDDDDQLRQARAPKSICREARKLSPLRRRPEPAVRIQPVRRERIVSCRFTGGERTPRPRPRGRRCQAREIKSTTARTSIRRSSCCTTVPTSRRPWTGPRQRRGRRSQPW